MAKENHLSYKVTPEGAAKIARIREKCIELDDLIDEVTSVGGREKSLAKTHLEDCRMWAVTAVVRLNNTGPVEDQGAVSGAIQDQAKAA